MQKVIVLPKDDQQTEELVLEEVEVFKVRETLCNDGVIGNLAPFLALQISNMLNKEKSFSIQYVR